MLTEKSRKIFSGHGAAIYLLRADKKHLTLQNTPRLRKLITQVEKLLPIHLPRVRVLLSAGSQHRKVSQSAAPQIFNPRAEVHVLLRDYANELNLPSKRLRVAAQKLIPKICDLLGLEAIAVVPLVSEDETLGMLDYARKDPFTEEDLQRLATIARHMTTAIRRRQAEEALAVEEERLSTTLRSITDGVIATDTSSNVILINHAAEELTGWSQEAAMDRPLINVFKATRAGQPLELPLNEVLQGKVQSIQEPDCVLISRNGKEHPFAGNLAPLGDKEDHIVGMVLVFKDTSERQLLENEMIRSQKLESLGILASGLAHDFNNYLLSIMLSIATAKLKSENNAEIQDLLTSAQQSITKATAITQQLLTFSRGGEPVKLGMHLQPLIEEAVSFSLHGRQVAAKFDFPPDLWLVDIDSGQINQVTNNLVLNAVQAMPEGGILTVSARNVTIDQDDSHESLAPGHYVRVDVQDDGPGIPPNIIDSIFDPYFTTRPGGSGLGLFSC